MIDEEVIERLHIHAAGTPDVSGPGFADVIWRCRNDYSQMNLEVVWQDIARLMQALQPAVLGWQVAGVPLPVSYSVSEIAARAAKLALVVPDREARRKSAVMSWRVAVGWEALMSLDIFDIALHVAGEERALQLSDVGDCS